MLEEINERPTVDYAPHKTNRVSPPKMPLKKLLLALLIATAIAAFFALGGHQYMTLAHLKASLSQLQALRASAPFLFVAGFFLLYVSLTALSLPVSSVLSVLAGALFGFFGGLLFASFASSMGATLAMLCSRYLFRDAFQARFGQRLHAVNEGLEKEGALYLFSLRLQPVFPFFLVNILMGLSTFSAVRFYWISQIGMLPIGVEYVNAGTQLAQLNQISDILSPRLIISFMVFGLTPLLAKWLLNRCRARQAK